MVEGDVEEFVFGRGGGGGFGVAAFWGVGRGISLVCNLVFYWRMKEEGGRRSGGNEFRSFRKKRKKTYCV